MKRILQDGVIHMNPMVRTALAPMIGLATAVGLGPGNAAVAQIRVNNVNAIHELYGENELAAKNQYNNKFAIVYGRVDKVDNSNLIIEGNSEFGRLFCKFSDADINKILALREDDPVTVQGTLRIRSSLFGMRLYMNDCRIL